MICCLDCPHHLEGYDPVPDLDDNFQMNDTYCVCKLLTNNKKKTESKDAVDDQPYRIITRAVRPYQLRKSCSVPKWCPLKTKKVNKKKYHAKKGRLIV